MERSSVAWSSWAWSAASRGLWGGSGAWPMRVGQDGRAATGGEAATTSGRGASWGSVPTSMAGSFFRFQGTVRRGSGLGAGGVGGGVSWLAAAGVGGFIACVARASIP
ncbi:hypothetical protein BJY00DRAFT_297677 [Aspergillus carlsbadensis]|nr:hypothetical protein BJY00DRAFT_297677 [Aspergillus carlsbadensis]